MLFTRFQIADCLQRERARTHQPVLGCVLAALTAVAIACSMSVSTAAAANRPHVACTIDGSYVEFFVKPRVCAFPVRGLDPSISANRVFVENLRWKRWGRRTATARGTYVGNMNSIIPVVVRLTRRDYCRKHHFDYRRVSIRPVGERKPLARFSLPTCPL